MVAIDGLLETMSHILDKMLPYQQNHFTVGIQAE